jgi:hypothetical protein
MIKLIGIIDKPYSLISYVGEIRLIEIVSIPEFFSRFLSSTPVIDDLHSCFGIITFTPVIES